MTQQRAGKPAWGGNKGKQKLQGPEQNKSHFGTSCTGKKKKWGGEGGENELAIFSKLPVRGIGQLGVRASVGGGSV